MQQSLPSRSSVGNCPMTVTSSIEQTADMTPMNGRSHVSHHASHFNNLYLILQKKAIVCNLLFLESSYELLANYYYIFL